MIHSENERRKIERRLNGLKIFENRTKGLIQSIGIDYQEPLLKARAEIEMLQTALDEFAHLQSASVPPVKSEIVEAIPLYLIKGRNRLGWSQKQLAQKTGFPPQSISKFEKDYSKVRLCNLIKIVRVVEQELKLKPPTPREARIVALQSMKIDM